VVWIKGKKQGKDTKSKLNPPTREEVWEIIRILKNNMSPRKDNISAEFI